MIFEEIDEREKYSYDFYENVITASALIVNLALSSWWD